MKNLRTLYLIATTGVLIAACSSGGDNSSPSPAPSTNAPQAVPTNPPPPQSQSQTQTPPQNQTQNPPPYTTVTPPPMTQPVIPQSANCYKSTPFICKIESMISDQTNAYRKSQGLQPLMLDAKMSFVARDWSVKQGSGGGGIMGWFSGGISHAGFPEERSAVYQREFNQSHDFSGENVAMEGGDLGSSGQTDADAQKIATDFATMWWNSAGHRANMLGQFQYIGVGITLTSDGSWYATQEFE